MASPIPNEQGNPDRSPRETNPIEGSILRATEKEGLQAALDNCRENYEKFTDKGDDFGQSTQQRLAQFIHQRAQQLNIKLD
jgi:hypothetical protein